MAKLASFSRKSARLRIVACLAGIECIVLDVMHMISSAVLELFEDECSEQAVEECNEFRPDVPLSDKFSSQAFDQYCG